MNDYDFEVLVDDINRNKENAILKDNIKSVEIKKANKKLRLRKWVKVALWTVLVSFLSIAIYQLKTVTTIETTPVGSYTCHGKLIQVCSGSKAVADYLGV